MNRIVLGASRLSITVMLVFSMLPVFQIRAASGPVVYFDPAPYEWGTNTMGLGDRFNATVWVSAPANFSLMMWQIFVIYDQRYINVTQFWGEDTLGWTFRVWPNDNLGGRSWDNQYVFEGCSGGALGDPAVPEPGSIMVGDLLASNKLIPGGVPKKLACFEFTIEKTPPKWGSLHSALNINNVDTYLYDKNGPVPDVTIMDSYYQLDWVAPPPAHLNMTRTDRQPWPVVFSEHENAVGKAFDVEIHLLINTAWDLTNATFTLDFNETLVRIIGGAGNVTVDSSWSYFEVTFETDQIAIFVTAATTPGPDALIATITFTVEHRGIYPEKDLVNLTFSGVRLWNHQYEIPCGLHGYGTVTIEGARASDLFVSSSNVLFSDPHPLDGQTITISATVYNAGECDVEDVLVRFFDAVTVIGEQRISFISHQSQATASVGWTAEGEGFHIIGVVVDPENYIVEMDESNNEATRSILVGEFPHFGGIAINGSAIPSETRVGWQVTIRGYVEYNTTYGAGEPVAEADVFVTIIGQAGKEAGHTLKTGEYIVNIIAPYSPGNYTVIVSVTDYTFWDSIQIESEVLPSLTGVDLTLSQRDISFSPSDPIENDNVEVTATIHNVGADDATNVLVAFYADGESVENRTISLIPGGGSQDATVSWNATSWGLCTIKSVADPENKTQELDKNNNEASKSIYVYPSLPDLTPMKIEFSDNTPAVDQTITICANVQNIGGINASNVLVSFYDDGQSIGSATIPLIPGKRQSRTASIDYSFSTNEWHVINATVDVGNIIREASEDNNWCTESIYVHLPSPDLTLSSSDIAFSNSTAAIGDTMSINATIHNVGEKNAYDAVVRFYDNDKEVGNATIPEVPLNSSETIGLVWDATPAGLHAIKILLVPLQEELDNHLENNNVATRYIYVRSEHEGLPDVCVYSEDIVFSNTVPEEGENVTLYATIHNIGNAMAENVTVTFYIDDIQTGQPQTLQSLPQGESKEFTRAWIALQIGSHVVKTRVDAAVDSSKDNNVATAARAIIVGAHDIHAVSVTSKSIVGQGYCMNVTATAANEGDFTEDFNITVYADLDTTIIGDEITVGIANANLAIGKLTNVTFAWSTTDAAKGNYTISVYACPVRGETHTADNNLVDGMVHVGVPGNVNYFDGSRMVDMIDLWLIQKYYGAVKGTPSPLYVPNYDVDDSGKIDMIDLWITQKHFGQTEP